MDLFLVNLLSVSVQKWTLALLHACQLPFIRLRPPPFPWPHHICISADGLCDLPGILHSWVYCPPSGLFLSSSSSPTPLSLVPPSSPDIFSHCSEDRDITAPGFKSTDHHRHLWWLDYIYWRGEAIPQHLVSVQQQFWIGLFLKVNFTYFKLLLLLSQLSCLPLCDPMDCSMPGFPVLDYLPEFGQTHVHWVSDAIQPFYPLSSPFPPALNLSQHQDLFQWIGFLHQVTKVLELQLQHQSSQ